MFVGEVIGNVWGTRKHKSLCDKRLLLVRPIDPLTEKPLGDALMAVSTPGLTTQPDVPGAAANAGQAVPAGNQIAIEKFAFRFDIREVQPDGTPIGPLPHNGTTLNSAIINNNPIVVRLALAQPTMEQLDLGLRTLSAMLKAQEDDLESTE